MGTPVHFFATCLGGAAFADTCLNAIALLQHAGCEVRFKKDQTCCGQPSFNSGYYDESRKIALHLMNLYANDNYDIVVPSGSCTGMMRSDYIELFEGTEHEKMARNFASRVYDLAEFLDKKTPLKLKDLGEKTKITWHSNCHALRTAKVIDSAKNLLRSLNNVELIELEREEECCGFGGTFSIKEPEISQVMVESKIADIEARGVEFVISGDAGCLLNISGAMKFKGAKTKPMHLYDFLAMRAGISAEGVESSACNCGCGRG